MGNSSSSSSASASRRAKKQQQQQEQQRITKDYSAEGKKAFLESTAGTPDDLVAGIANLSVSEKSAAPSRGPATAVAVAASASKKSAYQVTVKAPVRKAGQRQERLMSEGLENQTAVQATRPGDRPAYPSKKWSPEEDELLRNAVEEYSGKNWKAIAERVPNKTHLQCLQRWKKVLQPGLIKGHWTEEEDNMLRSLVDESGNTSWVAVAKYIPGRTAKQCRERWSLNLDPNINREPWTAEEDQQLMNLHNNFGNKWAEISGYMNGRTENAVKTRYKSLVRAQQKQWTPSEDRVVVDAKATANNRWVAIASQLPGRSKNAVRQRWKYLITEYPELEDIVVNDPTYALRLPDYMKNAFHESHSIHKEMRPKDTRLQHNSPDGYTFAQRALATHPPIDEQSVHMYQDPALVPPAGLTMEEMILQPGLDHPDFHNHSQLPADPAQMHQQHPHHASMNRASYSNMSEHTDLGTPPPYSGHSNDHTSDSSYYSSSNADSNTEWHSATGTPSTYSTDGEASHQLDGSCGYEASPEHRPIKSEPISQYYISEEATSMATNTTTSMASHQAVKYEPFQTTGRPLPTDNLFIDDFGADLLHSDPAFDAHAKHIHDNISSHNSQGPTIQQHNYPNHVYAHVPGMESVQYSHSLHNMAEPSSYPQRVNETTHLRGADGYLAQHPSHSASSMTSDDQFMLMDALQDTPAEYALTSRS